MKDKKLTMLLVCACGNPVLDRIADNERPTATVPANMTVLEAVNEFMRQKSNQLLLEEMKRVLNNPYGYIIGTYRGAPNPNMKLARYKRYMSVPDCDPNIDRARPLHLDTLTCLKDIEEILNIPRGSLTGLLRKELNPDRKLAEYMQYVVEDSKIGSVLPFFMESVEGVI